MKKSTNFSFKKIAGYFPETISKKQASDTGMAIVLILLFVGLFSEDNFYYKIAIPVLVINMIFPMLYYPIAIFWLGFSHLLGTVMSKIILTIVYIILVIPVGIIRRIMGKDPLQLNKFKRGADTVMKVRNYKFSSKDIENPY